MTELTPVFLLSLPRSGSTLLQRMLMGHPQIDSVAEPWFLLPLVYSLKQEGVRAEYHHRVAVSAVQDLLANMPDGRRLYLEKLRELAVALYQQLARGESRYFIDKTPRYYLIIPELLEMFPESKFIFLYRNPLAVCASIIETWSNGRLKHLHNYHQDLYEGIACLQRGQQLVPPERAIAMRYEDLVADPEHYTSGICEFLGLQIDSRMMAAIDDVDLRGSMGDKSGRAKYSSITAASRDGWKACFTTRVRQWWGRRYLESLGSAEIGEIGYDASELARELREEVPLEGVGVRDALDLLYTTLYRYLDGAHFAELFDRFQESENTGIVVKK